MQNVSAITSGCQSTAMNGSIRIRTEIETQKMAIGCQSIEDQNTEKMASPQEILPAGSIPLPHDGTAKLSGKKAGGKAEHRHQTPTRKRALVMREIPLYLLPAALQRGVKENGGKLYRVVIVRTHWHHYTIKIRCSTKKAVEHTDMVLQTDQSQHTDKVLQTDQSQHTEKVQQTDQSQHTEKVQQTDQSQHMDKVQQTNQSQQTDQTNTTGSSNRGGGT